MASDSSTASSTSSFVSAVIYNGVICAVFVLLFLIFRRKFIRLYQPKSFIETIPDNYHTEPLSNNFIFWIKDLVFKSDAYVLRQSGLDGYFFLRYLKLVIFICCIGIVLLYPILLPVNATGGAGNTGLDILSFSNIENQKRYYAHVFLMWIYFGVILFIIYREFIYFISVRQAVLTSPYYWSRISFRTVLFQTVPESYLNERTILSLFPEAKNVWINRSVAELEKKVAERDKLAIQLENAEVSLLKTAMKNKKKADKKNPELAGTAGPISDYVPDKKRPHRKLKFLIGKKVDTIDYNRAKIGELNTEIRELQDEALTGKRLNSCFVEFATPEAAFDAYQLVSHHVPLHMAPRFHGIAPETIIWPNMRILWWERLIRVFGTNAFITVLVIFWAIPVAAVGAISNITYLTDKVHFLRFILNCPKVLYGLITSLLPTILLAVLMMLLPIILRLMAKLSGAPSTSVVEYKVQNSYFAFQVVQVFLVTTITSSAASVVTQIVNDPTSAMSLLATNLPKSSNFFISYIILQGFSVGGGLFLQIVALIISKILPRILDGTPRKMFTRYIKLSSLGWGTIYPVYTNLAVISLTYSIISPLILVITAVAFSVLYLAFLYNFLYVYRPEIDMTGLGYPRALWQTFTGLYLSLVCLIGLFAVGKNWACIVLTAIMLGFTVFFHVTLKSAVIPLIDAMPKSIQLEHALHAGPSGTPGSGSGPSPTLTEKSTNNADDIEAAAAYEQSRLKARYSNAIWRFLRPDIYSSYVEVRNTMIPDWPVAEFTVDDERGAYENPSVVAQAPFLWIPRDPYGWSTTEVENTAGIIGISDEGSFFNEKGSIERQGLPPYYEEEKHL
ncbi:uncharacterized protein V1516DRAFT_633522 [Lipomyces oligophaga]|uniref:uncharacterized protein n=1 Tax=Lipomyces oligophaga TaxID=45792 RepID=UPI0034CD8670